MKFKLKDGRTLDIRKMTADDYDEPIRFLGQIAHETIYTTQYPGRPPKTRERLIKDYTNPNTLFIGAFDGEKLVAQVQIGKERPDHPWMKHLASFGIMVLTGYQQQGIARKLMAEMEKWARNNGITRMQARVHTTNKPALTLYQKCGFDIEGTQKKAIIIDNKPYDTHIIAKIFN